MKQKANVGSSPENALKLETLNSKLLLLYRPH